MAKDVVVETRRLIKVYRDFWGRQKKRALIALDLQIYGGEILGLLGRNGSGYAITMVVLANDKKRILKEYSKGMRQRIGLAQALINDPELVILDEPTSGLDPIATRWMKDLILNLKREGKTVIMCGHRLEDVQHVCDRIAILYDGDLQELGEVDKLVQVSDRIQVQASQVSLTPELKRDLEELFARHGG